MWGHGVLGFSPDGPVEDKNTKDRIPCRRSASLCAILLANCAATLRNLLPKIRINVLRLYCNHDWRPDHTTYVSSASSAFYLAIRMLSSKHSSTLKMFPKGPKTRLTSTHN